LRRVGRPEKSGILDEGDCRRVELNGSLRLAEDAAGRGEKRSDQDESGENELHALLDREGLVVLYRREVGRRGRRLQERRKQRDGGQLRKSASFGTTKEAE